MGIYPSRYEYVVRALGVLALRAGVPQELCTQQAMCRLTFEEEAWTH